MLIISVLASLTGSLAAPSTYAYKAWSAQIATGRCSKDSTPLDIPIPQKGGSGPPGVIACALQDYVKTYTFPEGVFEIDSQLLVPENTSIVGAKGPNDAAAPTKTPTWGEQTLFLATRGATDYKMNYCHAKDMVSTRVGFVLSSFVSVRNVSYQGIDTIRPDDNGALCGGRDMPHPRAAHTHTTVWPHAASRRGIRDERLRREQLLQVAS